MQITDKRAAAQHVPTIFPALVITTLSGSTYTLRSNGLLTVVRTDGRQPSYFSVQGEYDNVTYLGTTSDNRAVFSIRHGGTITTSPILTRTNN